MAEAPEERPIFVSAEELESERKELQAKETRRVELEATLEAYSRQYPERLLVLPSEWRRERSALGGLRTRIRTLWSEWGRLMAARRVALRAGEVRRAAAYLGVIRSTLREVRAAIAEERASRAVFRMKLIAPPELEKAWAEIETLTAEIEAEEERLGRKEIVVLEYIGVEEPTGYAISYRPEDKLYIVQHPETRELIREETWLCIIWTASVETDGGGSTDIPLVAEITMITRVKEKDAKAVEELVKEDGELDREALTTFYGEGWNIPLESIRKIGVSYIGYSYVQAKAYFEITAMVYETNQPSSGERRKRRYSLFIDVPEFPELRKYIERRSRYIPERHYIDSRQVALDEFIHPTEGA